MLLYIDDIRPAPDDRWIVVRTYDEAIAFIEEHGSKIELISLDHDLGDTNIPERTGYDIALHIVAMKFDNKPVPLSYQVHSANPVGAMRIAGVIERYLDG